MRSLIIINGYPSAEKFLLQGKKIQSALEKMGVETDLKKNGEVYALLKENGEIDSLAKNYDFVVYLDKDKYLPYMLEKMGLRLFNSARAVEICDDKMTTYLALGKCGVRIPQTIPAPLCYTKGAMVNEGFLDNVSKELGFPLILKKSYGSFGDGVHLVHGMPELKKMAQECLHQPHFFQEYIEESKGRDIRVIVIGGKALGGMERVAQDGEFRSNIELGGVGRKIELSAKYQETAEKVAQVLNLDYCGVDLLETKQGPVVCEVNSNAFFEGFEKVTGMDVAIAYAEYILESMKK